ncbi:MAG: hypothetical protein QM405_03850 [Euryarchaeota archaeon]|nr:hypothetical protein [Euryarchaeota archaeon]
MKPPKQLDNPETALWCRGGSTVTHIESDCKILVDTGFDYKINDSELNLKRTEITSSSP